MKTTIFVHNIKGGTGKTTLSIFVAEYFRLLGKKVIVLDIDYQQANACQYFASQSILMEKPTTLSTIIDFCTSNLNQIVARDIFTINELKQMVYDSLVYFNDDINSNFACVASNLTLEEMNNKLFFMPFAIKNIIKAIKEILLEICDVIIVDTPPAISPLVQGVYNTFDNLLIVSDVGEFGLAGINKTLHSYESFKYENANLNLLGILINKYENNNINKAFFSHLELIYKDKLISNPLMNYIDYQESFLQRNFLLREDYAVKNKKAQMLLGTILKDVEKRVRYTNV
jgi:chromosome partitioning protein